MLAAMHARGAADALAHFGVKEAFDFVGGARRLAGGVGRSLFGHPGRVFTEGANTFRPGGLLSAKNVFWPAVSGPGGSKMNWLARAGTVAMPLQAMHAMKANPEDGTLSNALGAAGGLAGMAYGFPALGALGAPIAGALASRAGRGIGHLLGSGPKDV